MNKPFPWKASSLENAFAKNNERTQAPPAKAVGRKDKLWIRI